MPLIMMALLQLLKLSSSLMGIFATNYMPALAYSFSKKNNVIHTQVSEYKFQNVNLDWWKNYNDEYLNAYIIKAVDNNQDLKIATLKVEEARQNVKLQFANNCAFIRNHPRASLEYQLTPGHVNRSCLVQAQGL